jgi:ATP-dependent exoDNAse (exonuclease V) beta subunit
MSLIDQSERDRFILEPERNLSVIAPAGVGKTRSIVERIVHLARLKPEAEAVERLSRLIVVTYSVKAAQEMQQRARVAIRAAQVSAAVQRAFQQTFFGTIHSYCVRLLDRFGHYLGLPSSVTLLQADDELWNRFLTRGLGQGNAFHEDLRELFHFYAPEKLYALSKEISPGPEEKVGPLPNFDAERLLDYRDERLHQATRASIVRAQESVRQWTTAWARGDGFRALPACPESKKAVAFAALWEETFAPLHEWLRASALAFGRHLANAYEAFRLSEAVMTYDDQVRLALRLLDHPAVRRELAAEPLSVLLDEAQDTDPRQFEVLRRIAGLRGGTDQAPGQSFCVVGDFQQAIYAPRSDLTAYRRLHEEISTGARGASCRLQVTFRCDRAIIDFVNRIFPIILNNTAGQCEFVPLEPRDDAGGGTVVRWICPDEPTQQAGEKISSEVRARHEAKFVAQRIHELGPVGLGADGWSQVAVLAPRRKWLLDLQRELVALGLPVQLHSSNEQQGDRASGAWLTALIWIAAHPEDTFEIAGVLREIFGVSDHDLAIYTGGEGQRLRLDRPLPPGDGPVESALILLREACLRADRVPLDQAVRTLAEQTHLRARLESIPEWRLENVARELDDFLALIAERSADGVTLVELAQELRAGLTQVFPAEEEIREAIQLLTSHKAKGLEWQTVIVPYVFRSIEAKSPAYPRLVQAEGGREIICRDKADFVGQAREVVIARERQQLQRLLYVMSTRAKRTLLLLDDEELYAKQKRRGGWSAAELLELRASNRETWLNLPGTLAFRDPPLVVEAKATPIIDPASDVTTGDLQLAIAHAQAIVRRITPHALAVRASAKIEPERPLEREEGLPAADSPGLRYGTWWHELVQTIPWRSPLEAWQTRFLEALAGSPQQARARREWEIFCGSPLARWLAAPGRLVQVELPFLWLETAESCLEGVIDLAVYSSDENAWQVIDWKTNRLGEEGATGIVETYREQIRAYVRVLREMLSARVRGSLYLTQTGEWLPVD